MAFLVLYFINWVLTKVYLKINLFYMKNSVIGLKELRNNVESYIQEVKRGKSFVVVRRSKPVFKITPPKDESELWETVVDFTKLKKGGVPLKEILSHLKNHG